MFARSTFLKCVPVSSENTWSLAFWTALAPSGCPSNCITIVDISALYNADRYRYESSAERRDGHAGRINKKSRLTNRRGLTLLLLCATCLACSSLLCCKIWILRFTAVLFCHKPWAFQGILPYVVRAKHNSQVLHFSSLCFHLCFCATVALALTIPN